MSDLRGACVLVTRPARQAENLCRLIDGHGGVAIRLPAIEIVPVDDTDTIKKVLANLDEFQWLVFISVNAVNFALQANGGKIPGIKTGRIAAIGHATGQALADVGLSADLLPDQVFNSEALLACPEFHEVGRQSILIVRGSGGRDELATTLRARGAKVRYLDVYKRIIPDIDCSDTIALLIQNRLDIITATSGEILHNLLIMLDEDYHEYVLAIPLVVISERIRQLAVEFGFKQIVVASNPSDTAIFEAVMTCLMGKERGRIE